MTNPLDHVGQLCEWLGATDIAVLELCGPSGTLRLSNDGSSVRVHNIDESTPASPHEIAVGAPSPGIFLDRHPLHERAMAAVGAHFQAGEPLGFLQVGPLLTPVASPQAGTVVEVLVEHGTVVGYGEPLFQLQSSEGVVR